MTSGSHILAELYALQQADQKIEVLNTYKGIPVISKGAILTVGENEIECGVAAPESVCLAWQRSTLLRYPAVPGAVRARVLAYQPQSGLVRLGNFRYVNYRERKHIRVEPRNPIPIQVDYGMRRIVGTMVDISLTGLGVYIPAMEPDNEINRTGALNIQFSLPDGPIQCTGQLRAMGQSLDYYRLAINFAADRPENEKVKRYINHRREEILAELSGRYLDLIQTPQAGHPALYANHQ